MMAPMRDQGTVQNIRMLADSAYVRDGRHRLPTANRKRVMALAMCAEDKHRLGKQQQLLTDIARRCREQEVSDLSGVLSRKVHFSPGENRGLRDFTFYGGQLRRQLSMLQTAQSAPPEKGNTMFPLRSPIRSIPRGSGVSLPRVTSYNKSYLIAPALNSPKINMATNQPVFLPSINYIGVADNKNIESYIKGKSVPVEVKRTLTSLDSYSSAGMGQAWKTVEQDLATFPDAPPPTER